MSKNSIPISMKATLKIEKYPEGTTQEQIENGEVEPVEVTISEDDFDATAEQVEELFKNIEEE